MDVIQRCSFIVTCLAGIAGPVVAFIVVMRDYGTWFDHQWTPLVILLPLAAGLLILFFLLTLWSEIVAAREPHEEALWPGSRGYPEKKGDL
jgi:O-antigen/teichoic acid export membrane protein